MKPLEGICVLDLTRLLPGAVATQQLVDWGAEVIKIEQPGAGDYARDMSPAVFAQTNSGKKSVSVDLKHLRGREILLSMVKGADILVEGFRPGVMARLGLSYPELCALNERLIYVSLTGYGQNGPYADLAGHDVNYLALGGVLGLNLPVIPGVQIADLVGGSMQSVIGVLLALEQRHRSGKGRHVDVSMYAGVTSLLTVPLAVYLETGHEAQTGGERLSGAYACYNIYQTEDGRWVAVGALEPKFWAELCKRLNCEDLIALQFAGPDTQAMLKSRLDEIFRSKTAAAWFQALRGSDCCVTPVRSIGEVAAELPRRDGPPPPKLGEHTSEVLRRLGISEDEARELQRSGAIA
jgi:crotonobetainyl-CoA:carnitine CoA-transferase CaiB-like acyl-CoA transferase